MFRKSLNFILLLFFITGVSVCYAYAECEHNFEPAKDNSNLIYNIDMSHSYCCQNGCGEYGTVKNGIHGRENCSFYLSYEVGATCVSKGKRAYLCSVCCIGKEESLPLKKHDYKRIRRLPTCTAQGYDLYTCSVCKDSYKTNYIKPISHIYDGGTVEALPTYEKTGTLKNSCRVCGYVIGKELLPKLVRTSENIISVGSVSGFKVKSSDDSSVKLSWKKSDGAVSYRIYYSTDKKKWKAVTSKKTSVTVKNLKSAKKYYFKITAVGANCNGKESKIISVCTKPVKAAFKKLKSAKKSTAALEWKKLNSVSGYEISYTSSSFSKKKTVKTLDVSDAIKKTLKKLKSGKKYSFRVRAYKIYDAKKVYGAYSEVKTLKIK